MLSQKLTPSRWSRSIAEKPPHNVVFNALTAPQWQHALAQAPYHAFQQSWAYGQAATSFGAHIERAALYLNHELVGVAQLQCKKLAKLLPVSIALRGPVWLSPLSAPHKALLYQALQRALPHGKPRIALWMPESDDTQALHLAKTRQVLSPYHTVMLDLSQPLEQIRLRLDGKWRNRLVAAEDAALKINTLKNYQFLLEHEAQQSSHKGYTALSPMFVPAYQFECGQKNVLCLAAMQKGTPVAAILCLIHEHCATYHIGWSNDEGKKANAHNLLLWSAIKQLKARGVRMLDLGGIHTDGDGAGIARFKIGTGGTVTSLAGTFF